MNHPRDASTYSPIHPIRRCQRVWRVTFIFDLAGNRTLMNDSVGRTSFTYDALDRVATATNPFGRRITYSYDKR